MGRHRRGYMPDHSSGLPGSWRPCGDSVAVPVSVSPGSQEVAVRDARGFWVRKLAVGEGGRDFPCVLVVWEDEPDGDPTPWPLEDVRPAAEVPDALTHDAYRELAAQ